MNIETCVVKMSRPHIHRDRATLSVRRSNCRKAEVTTSTLFTKTKSTAEESDLQTATRQDEGEQDVEPSDDELPQ